MDNGLIFPYRRRTVHGEAGDAKHPKPSLLSGGGWWSVWSDPVVVKRVNRGDAGG